MFFRDNAVTDGTYASANLMIMTCVEPGIYLIAACLVTLRPLLQRIFKGTTMATLARGNSTWNYEETSSDQNDTKLMDIKNADFSRNDPRSQPQVISDHIDNSESYRRWDSEDRLVPNPVYQGKRSKNGHIGKVDPSAIVIQRDYSVTSNITSN